MRTASPSLKYKCAEFGLADASRVCQHCVEHGLQLARRTADDAVAPPMSRSAAPAPRQAAALPRQRDAVPQQARGYVLRVAPLTRSVNWARWNARSRLRSARTKLATLRSALRAFARQGHLVGTPVAPGSPRPCTNSLTRQGRRLVRAFNSVPPKQGWRATGSDGADPGGPVSPGCLEIRRTGVTEYLPLAPITPP